MLLMLPSPGGIEPTTWLSEKSRTYRWDRLASEAGMGPVKLLFLSVINVRDVDFSPSLAAMGPPSVLLSSLILVMLMQELRFIGNVPEELSYK